MTELEQTLKDLEQGNISADHAEVVILRLFSVVGRSEQLFCHHEGKYTLKSDGNCCKCHLPPKPKAK